MTQRRKRYGKQFKATAARVVPGGETRVVDLAVYLRVSVPRLWGVRRKKITQLAHSDAPSWRSAHSALILKQVLHAAR